MEATRQTQHTPDPHQVSNLVYSSNYSFVSYRLRFGVTSKICVEIMKGSPYHGIHVHFQLTSKVLILSSDMRVSIGIPKKFQKHNFYFLNRIEVVVRSFDNIMGTLLV